VKLWSDYQVRGLAVLPSARVLVVCLCFWLGAYGLVRMMKKRGYVKG
jgi:hypothetical protein